MAHSDERRTGNAGGDEQRLLAAVLLLLAVGIGAPWGCEDRQDDDDETEDDDDASAGDDDSADDDTSSDDDDFTFENPPVFLAAYDFSLVMYENAVTGTYGAVHGQMDVYVSTTDFLAEMDTTDGLHWEWGGSLEDNEQRFDVHGYMQAPSMGKEIPVEVVGNFLADTDLSPSESCLVGLGEDDDPNLPDQGVRFAWYGCKIDAPEAAVDRSGSHTVSVQVNGGPCASAWGGVTTTSWSENWQFQGRKLIVSRAGITGYGVLSDDGNVFHFTMLEQESPGRSLKVVGDWTDPNGTGEAVAQGFCHESTGQIGASIFMNY